MEYHNIIVYYSVGWIMNVYSGMAIWKECFDVVWIMNGVLINEEKLFIINYSPV